MTAPTRRERLRTATLAEIKEGARRLLVTGGVDAVSLRAIARDMGMTAPAIYRYFPAWRRWSRRSPATSTTSCDAAWKQPGTPPAASRSTNWWRCAGPSGPGRWRTRPSSG